MWDDCEQQLRCLVCRGLDRYIHMANNAMQWQECYMLLGYTYVQIFLATDFHIYFKCYNSGGDEVEEEKRLSWKNVIIWTGGDGPCRVFDIYNYIDISKLWLNMNS